MKEDNKIPKFYTHLILFMAAVIIVTLVFLAVEKKLSCCYYVIVIEGSIFLVIMGSGIYSCLKMKMLVHDDSLVFYNNKKRIEIRFDEIGEIGIKPDGNVFFILPEKEIPLSHSIIDSSELLKLLYDNLSVKRPDLLTTACKQRLNEIYKNSLTFDVFAYLLEKVGFFATVMAILSFFVAMFMIFDYRSIRLPGEIAYLLYALGWPYLPGLLLFLRFTHKIKSSEIALAEPEEVPAFFHEYPYSMIFSTFAEIFIALSVIIYFY